MVILVNYYRPFHGAAKGLYWQFNKLLEVVIQLHAVPNELADLAPVQGSLGRVNVVEEAESASEFPFEFVGPLSQPGDGPFEDCDLLGDDDIPDERLRVVVFFHQSLYRLETAWTLGISFSLPLFAQLLCQLSISLGSDGSNGKNVVPITF